LRDISERFEKVTLVALNSKDNRSHCDKIEVENIEVKVFNRLTLSLVIFVLFRAKGSQILFYHQSKFFFLFPVLKLIAIKSTVYLGVAPRVSLFEGSQGWMFRLHSLFFKFAMRHCDKVVVRGIENSIFARNHSSNVFEVSSVSHKSKSLLTSPLIVRKGKQNKSFKILFVGKWEEQKNHKLFLDSAEFLVETLGEQERQRLAINIIGNGEFENNLIIPEILRGILTFTGYLSRTSLVQELKTANLLVHPSKEEGLPRVFEEALYCGLPILVSDLPGIPSQFYKSQDEMRLTIINQQNPEIWARHMKTCFKTQVSRKLLTKADLERLDHFFGDYFVDIL